MVYIFLYNVIYIKSDLKKLKELTNAKFILIGSAYCFKRLASFNKHYFDHIHQITRDFQQIDYDEVAEIVVEYIKEHGASNVRLLTNEDSTQIACARLREKYGIPGHNVETILPFVNKVVSKSKLENVVRIPKFLQFNKQNYLENKETYLTHIVNHIGNFPMFVKPVDLVSSVETHYIPDFESLRHTTDMMAEHDYDFEIDEFIDGDLFHCDALVINGQIKFFMVGKCSFALARFFEGKPVGSIPINDKELFGRLQKFCEKVFNKLGCLDIAYHLEVFLDRESQELVFLEVGARTGGALIFQVYQKIFDINIEESNYLIQLGLLKEISVPDPKVFAGFLNFPTIDGKVLKINPPVLNLPNKFINFMEPNDVINQATNLLDIACSIIFWGETYEEIESTFEFLKNYQPIELHGSINLIS